VKQASTYWASGSSFIGTFQTGKDLPWYYLVPLVGRVLRLYNQPPAIRAWGELYRREDEPAASAMGINLTKLLAFAMGHLRGLLVHFTQLSISAIFPSVFDFPFQ